MEKARSLHEAAANPDDMDEGLYASPRADGGSGAALRDDSEHHSSSPAAAQRGAGHPSGFVAASVSQSGFSPIDAGRGEPSGLQTPASSGVESGVVTGVMGYPSGHRLVESLQGALGAASRNEAGLGSLQRAIRDASRAFTASRQAQEALTEELRVMHRGLNELMSEKAAVERYAALLTQERDAALDAAEEARREAKREREFLLREQDRFIQLLLEEHEAELQQLRHSSSRSSGTGDAGASNLAAAAADVAPATVPGVPPALGEQPAEGRKSTPPGEFLSGAALARQALANAAGSSSAASSSAASSSAAGASAVGNVSDNHPAGVSPVGSPSTSDEPMPRAVPLPGDKAGEGVHDIPRPEARAEDERVEERAPTYPPAPAVLDLDSLAAEIDGNSERPPPIRRLGVAEPKIHLKPARVPTELFDTLVSSIGEVDPNRKG